MTNVISTRLLDAMVEQAIGFVRQAVCNFYTVFVCIRIILIQEEVNRFHLLGRKQQQNLWIGFRITTKNWNQAYLILFPSN